MAAVCYLVIRPSIIIHRITSVTSTAITRIGEIMNKKYLLAILSIVLATSGCTTLSSSEQLHPKDTLVSFREFSDLDVLEVTPQELLASSEHVLVGQVIQAVNTRSVKIRGGGPAQELAAFEIRVTNVLKGNLETGSTIALELVPLEENRTAELSGLVSGLTVVVYANDAPTEDANHSYISLRTLAEEQKILQMTGPYGVIFEDADQGLLIWPLATASIVGADNDVWPSGRLMQLQEFNF